MPRCARPRSWTALHDSFLGSVGHCCESLSTETLEAYRVCRGLRKRCEDKVPGIITPCHVMSPAGILPISLDILRGRLGS